jgi:hypothetical protein
MADEPVPPEVVQVLERVALTEAAAVALNAAMVTQGDRQVDVVNRALQMYEFTLRHDIYVQRRLDGWLGWLGFSRFTRVELSRGE